ncbi:aspartyl/asparaginyl beta-hydroxylase domain-containing protein [Mucilaginibacter sp. HC2]|uniref:aspartyl/asparaginyl beta-hydroxylase domain-containing protein n=1 Tax=Mucilaginibacter inviolabilis TaxID=2714892 RepID=UPI00140C4797|nr:aspartyl/asparaginyl beta-hydroxylase domain-containing protein [Mucilaginibacter inviolabilis]NHA07183.1 aspartyl/asparaginyl beta-hydroxylase domain-containing protein [Mucilaginibacter inviolabilis]
MIIRYARLSLLFDPKVMQAELALPGDQWQAHFNTSYYQGSWTVLALRSPGGNHTNITPDLMADTNFRDTSFMQHFPSVSRLISDLHCPVMAVRFLKLEAGAVIRQHRDNELAFEKGEARLHFPVITNPQVMFYIEDERVLLQEGESWYINANLPHRVSNEGAIDRIHLVIDCKVNDWLAGIINGSDKISFREEHKKNELPQIIRELRLQNTAVSNKLAAELEQQPGDFVTGNDTAI